MSARQQNAESQGVVEALASQIGELGTRLARVETEVGQQVDEGDGVMAELEGESMPVGVPPSSEPCLFDLAYLTESGHPTTDSRLCVYYPRVYGGVVLHLADGPCQYDRGHLDVFDPLTRDGFYDDHFWLPLKVNSGGIYLNVAREGDRRVWWLDTTGGTGDVSVQLGIADEGERRVRQSFHGILVLGDDGVGVQPGPDPSGDAVPKVLGGTDYNAATDSWQYGEIDTTTGKPTYPVFNPTRLYWWEDQHKLLCFRRTMTYNSSGLLVAVSAENLDPAPSVFTTVAEMP